MNHMQILTKNAKILWNGLSLEKTSKSDKPGYAEESIFSKKSPVKSQPTVRFKRNWDLYLESGTKYLEKI